MPACGKRVLGLFFGIDNVDLSFSEPKRGLQRFDKTRAIFRCDRNPVLNHLNARAEPSDLFGIGIHSHDFVVDPDSEITLLLKELEKFSRFRFCRNGDPKGDKNIFAGAIAQNFVSD